MKAVRIRYTDVLAAELLKLPSHYRIVNAEMRYSDHALELVIEGHDLPEVAEGSEPPLANLVVHTRQETVEVELP